VAVPKAVVPSTPVRYIFATPVTVAVPKALVPSTPVTTTSVPVLPKAANGAPANELTPNIGYLPVKLPEWCPSYHKLTAWLPAYRGFIALAVASVFNELILEIPCTIDILEYCEVRAFYGWCSVGWVCTLCGYCYDGNAT
jgi:hypothetical protein